MGRINSTIIPFTVAAVIGMSVWLMVSRLSGVDEAWDAPIYWSAGYPFLVVACFALGWFFSRRAWAFGFIAMMVQSLPMLVPLPDDLSLYPLGLVFLGVVSLPLMIAGVLGAKAKKVLGEKFT